MAKAETDSAAPSAPLLQTPLRMMARDMMVHTHMVSTNTSNMPHRPCRTGCSTLAWEWTMVEEPCPASLLNTDRAMPCWITREAAAPEKPPTAAVPVKALPKIRRSASGRLRMLMMTTPSPAARNKTIMAGTILPANSTTRLPPPQTMTHTTRL